MDIAEVELVCVIGWKNEDELPDWVDDEVYGVLRSSSKLIDGCRCFPYVSVCGKEIFLINEI